MIPGFPISVLLLKIIVIVSFVEKVVAEKSLFDEVPLNGALIPSDLDYSSLPPESFTSKLPPDPTDPSPPSQRKHHDQDNTGGGGSLFDDLPNQGALSDQQTQSSRNLNKIRTPRDSVDFEITRINPSSDFDLPYWDKQFLAPIVNSIAARPPPHDHGNSRFPFLNFMKSPKHLYGPPPRRHNNQYGNYHPPSHHQEWHQHSHPHQNQPVVPLPVKVEEEGRHGQNHNNKSLHVSANSGGPTVIVYTNPKKDAYSHSSQKESSHWTSTEAPAKNEIHYHYHMQNEHDSRPKPPPYGRRPLFPSRGRYSHPPKHAYGPPAPPPPQKASGYPPSATAQSNTYHTDSSKGSTFSFNEENEHDGDDFSQRTFITKSRTPPSSYNPAAELSTSYEIPPAFNAPSSTYAVPPPSSKYGVSHKEPESSYGPPSTSPPAPPPPPQQSDIGGDQYETTITLQTIPVTRQVTELVQVPNVVHKISSNRPHQAEQAQAQLDDYGQQQQLSTAYGPLAPPPSRTVTITTPSPRNERPFETHLSQILGVSSSNPQTSNNNNNAILQELLLSQSRSPGYDLTLSDIELLSLLQGSKSGGSSVGILQPQRSNLFGGLFGTRSQFPVSSFGTQNSAQGGWAGGGGGDGLSSFREAFREQRLQIALQDLRKQLRDQNRDNQRERSGVRSLFTKGAMLLSALTLLPTMMNPVAAAAGFGSASGSAAAAASASIPNFMLPMSGLGRRKRRSLQLEKDGILGKCRNNDIFIPSRSENKTVINYRRWMSSPNLELKRSKGKIFRDNNGLQKSHNVVQFKFLNILRDSSGQYYDQLE